MMRKPIFLVLVGALHATPAAAQVPDASDLTQQIWDAGHNSNSLPAIWCFTEAAALALHRADERFGHLRKNPGQNQHNGHAVDAVLFCNGQIVDGKCRGATATAIDLISEAIGATPHWSLDDPRPEYVERWFAPTAGCGPGGGGSSGGGGNSGGVTNLQPVLDAIAGLRERIQSIEGTLNGFGDSMLPLLKRLEEASAQTLTAATSAQTQASTAATNTAEVLKAIPTSTCSSSSPKGCPEYVLNILGRPVIAKPRQ